MCVAIHLMYIYVASYLIGYLVLTLAENIYVCTYHNYMHACGISAICMHRAPKGHTDFFSLHLYLPLYVHGNMI